MDKLSVISAALFLAADVFAITSLCMPYWIISANSGNIYIGLLQTCIIIYNRQMECFTPDNIQPELVITFVLISGGIICITITICFLIISCWRFNVMKYARWFGFVAMVMFCLAAIIFPISFYMDQIGGEIFQLPPSFHVGIAYIFFVLALWITVVSELFAGKVCLPHF
ncbi:hypothetical protein HELRODRAFT_175436 [Helobdella robusta]|uniref:Uncharacterized protein n=1 Tax=Helobdella robusta TaxID=6412 RepID=T1F994_HELRO|nr:hypothetical protein HELRODRAFT_175436 [Helobdella robusta]ESO00937.1 hypothetical protein HELRODRAFT_175436 [Helobdella robusta]